MSYKDISEGEKIAKVRSARFIKAKKGTVGLEVSFHFEEPSTNMPEVLSWVAWLSEKAIDNSMETLVNTLGYNGSELVDGAGVLTDPEAFDKEREVRLVVENETNPESGKTYPKIKWVNTLGGGGFAAVHVETLQNDLKATGFKAALMKAKSAAGKPVAKNHAPKLVTEEKLPF